MTVPNPLFRRASVPATHPENLYERFGLTQNPFPEKPSVMPDSHDPRLNGSIYRADLRAQEQETFEHLLVPSPKRPDVRPIAFLMDYATRRGRGIGKTAFLNYQRKRIMADLGNDITSGSYVLFAAYVLPPAEGRCRKFWQFAQLLAETFNEQQIIAQAIWRLRAFSDYLSDHILAQVGDDPQGTIGNDEWLTQKGVSVLFELNHAIESKLKSAGVRPHIAATLANFGHSPDQFRSRVLTPRTDYRWREDSAEFVFNDLTRLFQAANFHRGLLLIDEVEKIVVHQNTKERRTFVEDIRYFFVDGPYQSAINGFYGLLLTIHPYIQELLAPHWDAAGMDRFCTLSGELAAEYTIYFNPLGVQYAVPLVLEYLDRYRINSDDRGHLIPFDQPAVLEAHRLAKGVPGPMLALLRRVMDHAASEEWPAIGAEQIRRVFQMELPLEPDDKPSEEPLPPAQVDLRAEE